MESTASATPILDSILHSNKKRVAVGIFAGLLSGAIMLFITTLIRPAGANSLWWLNLCSTVFYTRGPVALNNGMTLAYDAPSNVILLGALFHFGVSAFCGLLVGKLSTSTVVWKMATYGLVIGGLCWLASHMFGPDILYFQQVEEIPELTRIAFFVPFGVLIGVFTAIFSKAVH